MLWNTCSPITNSLWYVFSSFPSHNSHQMLQEGQNYWILTHVHAFPRKWNILWEKYERSLTTFLGDTSGLQCCRYNKMQADGTEPTPNLLISNQHLPNKLHLFNRTYRGADKSLAWPHWKNNWKVTIFHLTWRSLLMRRPGWTDNLLNFFWVVCKS